MKEKANRLLQDPEDGLKALQEHNRGGKQLRVTTLSLPEVIPVAVVEEKGKTAYTVLFQRGPLGWAALVPDLPGCVAKGITVEEAEADVRLEIIRYIEAAITQGEAVPAAVARAKMVLATVQG